jgi:5-dehydro-4-deoxyglucarate dehydratase
MTALPPSSTSTSAPDERPRPLGGTAPLSERLEGLLFFPVTPYGADGEVDVETYRAHVRRGVDAGAGAVFACCGTGEFHALTPQEYRECVEAAVVEAGGRVPVVAGTGYGTALARRFAELAEEAGADGLLAMPPYLVTPDQEGLVRHYAALAEATALDVIVYQRDNVRFTPSTVVRLARTPGIAGLKDGLGDLDLMQRIVSAVRTEAPAERARAFRYFNGLPTAELTGPAYRSIGVTLYSSAVFCFLPEVALAFHRALLGGDDATVQRLLDGFFRPLVELRNQGRGYAVSLVKAGVRLRGLDVGEVRPPLSEPAPGHLDELAQLIERGLALVDRPTGAEPSGEEP